MQEIEARVKGDHFVSSDRKNFVINGDKDDFLIIVTNASSPDIGYDVVNVDSDSDGVQFEETWEGLGLRGNNSIDVGLEEVKVLITNLLGQEATPKHKPHPSDVTRCESERNVIVVFPQVLGG